MRDFAALVWWALGEKRGLCARTCAHFVPKLVRTLRVSLLFVPNLAESR